MPLRRRRQNSRPRMPSFKRQTSRIQAAMDESAQAAINAVAAADDPAAANDLGLYATGAPAVTAGSGSSAPATVNPLVAQAAAARPAGAPAAGHVGLAGGGGGGGGPAVGAGAVAQNGWEMNGAYVGSLPVTA